MIGISLTTTASASCILIVLDGEIQMLTVHMKAPALNFKVLQIAFS